MILQLSVDEHEAAVLVGALRDYHDSLPPTSHVRNTARDLRDQVEAQIGAPAGAVGGDLFEGFDQPVIVERTQLREIGAPGWLKAREAFTRGDLSDRPAQPGDPGQPDEFM